MVVSRYVVDATAIVGLVVGTMGVIFLSQGLFGKSAPRVLRITAISIGMGMLDAVFTAIYVAATPVPLPYDLSPTIAVLAGAAFGVVIEPILLLAPATVRYIIVPVTVLILLLVALFVIPHYFPASSSLLGYLLVPLGYLITSTYLAAVILLVSLVTSLELARLAGDRSIGRMSVQQFQVLGFALTLLGIGTQFVSPILDLLNIPVR